VHQLLARSSQTIASGLARVIGDRLRAARAATLRMHGREFTARLTETDPWDGVKLRAVGAPPWDAAPALTTTTIGETR
jgi:hypothetical protein